MEGETRINRLSIGAPEPLRARIPHLQRIRIKLEVDTDPPGDAEYVRPFAREDAELALWSPAFFSSLVDRLTAAE